MDVRQYAPATQRNREPILEILNKYLSNESIILEIASGTGEHAVYFADRLKIGSWIPSDINPAARESIVAWKKAMAVDRLASPLSIDVTQDDWSDAVVQFQINAIVNINMIHIAPWSACLGLIRGAERLLASGGILYLYGPFKRHEEHTAASNERFDRSLRDRNPEWGVRNLETVVEIADRANLQLEQIVEMPANNLSVIFIKS